MFDFVWFDLHYCKESSGFLTIVFFCGLTFISLHNLPLRLIFNVCVIFFCLRRFTICSRFTIFIQFNKFSCFRSMCLISYRCFFILVFRQLFTKRPSASHSFNKSLKKSSPRGTKLKIWSRIFHLKLFYSGIHPSVSLLPLLIDLLQ